MKKIIRFLLLLVLVAPLGVKAQFEQMKDSVVQLYGLVMTADSLKGIPAVSIMVVGRHQGTMSNDQGVFSIALLKGDTIEFTSVGYKPKRVGIPRNIEGNSYSVLQLMAVDTQYLGATVIRPRPTREQFERDFVNVRIPDDAYEIARKNTDADTRRSLMRSTPRDAREVTNYTLRQNAQRFSYAGQLPPQNIFNPTAWAEFINAWKRGDFKNKN